MLLESSRENVIPILGILCSTSVVPGETFAYAMDSMISFFVIVFTFIAELKKGPNLNFQIKMLKAFSYSNTSSAILSTSKPTHKEKTPFYFWCFFFVLRNRRC